MDFSSFLTSLGTSFAIFVVLMLLFTWLSRKPGNAVVYYPNRILKGLDPVENGYATRNPFVWIREAFSSTEADIIRMSGVDTAVYFVFLTTALGILVISGLILLPTLLPVASSDHSVRLDNTTSKGTFNDLDKLSMGHVGKNSPRLWAFIIATYWVSFVTYFLLWKAYKHVAGLRVEAQMSPEVRAEQFAILVRDIPPVPQGQSRKEQVDSYFSMIYPDTFYRSILVTDNNKANKIYEELVGYKKKLERAEAIHTQEKKAKPDGERPTSRTGFLGIVGKKVDSIDFFNEKIQDLTSKLEAEQKITLKEKQHCSAIIFFTNRMTATSAAQSLHSPMVDTWTVTGAPEPRQVFVGYGLELSRIIPLVIFHLKRKYMCKTEAEMKEAWTPGDLGYATRFPGDMLILTISLCYSVIAPIIIPFGAVYFGLGWLLLRNQALKVYVPSFESYGQMWPHMHTRILAALVLYQLTMFGYFGAKLFHFTPVIIPLPILSFIFAVCRKRFYRFFQCTALEAASHELKEVPNMETIFRSFIPPCLGAEKSDGDHFEDALSHASKTASSV